MTMITPSYLGETIEYSSLHACRSTLEDPSLQSVTVANAASLNMSAGITFAAWINPVDWSGNRRFLQKGNSDNQYRFLVENNVLKFHLNGVGTLTYSLPPTNAWTHVAATWDGATMTIYTNGQPVASQPATGAITGTSDPLTIGTKNTSGVSGDFFNGQLDEVRLYNRALGLAEINTVMHAGDTPLATPTGLSGASSSSLARLSWAAAAGASSYHVKRSNTSGGPYTVVGTSPVANYTDAGLTNGTTYYYVVSGLNSTNESANSAQISVKPGLGVVFFVDVNYTGGASQPLGAGNYTLTQLIAAGMPNDVASSCTVPNGWTVAVYQDDNYGGTLWTLSSDTPNFTAYSGLNDNMSSCKITAGSTPSIPVALAAVAGNAQVAVVWNTTAGATGYTLKRSLNISGPFTPLASSLSTHYTDTSSANGTTYYYVVSAANAVGESANSTPVSATPVAQPVLSVGPQTNGQFSFQFTGTAGQNYIVQTSTNLVDWTPVFTNQPVGGVFVFTDTNAIVPALFYRVEH